MLPLNFLSLDALAPYTAGYGTQFRFLQCMAAHFNGAADRIHRQRYTRRQLHGQIFAVGRKSPYISGSAETDVQHYCKKAVPIQTVTNAIVVLTAVLFHVLKL